MAIGKSVLVALGALSAAGAMVSKVVQKKKPQAIKGLENLEKKIREIKKNAAETLKTAREAFREGYSQG